MLRPENLPSGSPLPPYAHVGVIGGGAWGTALAQAACVAGRRVTLWAREPDVVAAIREIHENRPFLPGIVLDPALTASPNLVDVVTQADVLLLVAPAQHLRAVTAALAPHRAATAPVVIAAKGIEIRSGSLMSAVVSEILPTAPVAVLSGPTFAAEVARGLPAAVTLACADTAIGQRLAVTLGTPCFRPYLSDDVIGAQVGGAVKNVLAIACGVVEGRQLGDNARAALITRGLAEMVRLAQALGGRAETLQGLSGLGDLTLTCTGMQSRNLSLGYALGEGQTLDSILAGRSSVAEGVYTATALARLAARLGVDMPICAAVEGILHQGANVEATISALLARPFRSETTGPVSDTAAAVHPG